MLALAAAVVLALPAGSAADHPAPVQLPRDLAHPADPLNDLFALGQGGGQTPPEAPVQRPDEPPLEATPRAACGAGFRTEPGIQGRVPAGAAREGLACNAREVARQGRSGGFKVLRYVDKAGRECAYYDTALVYPINAFRFDGGSQGVAVLDMSDPSRPVQTDTLSELPMLSPHESLSINQERGLLAAVLGNPATYPGLVSIYDASEDCRHPVLQSTSLVARFGHESGFSQDGKTFYATGTAVAAITAIDVTDPKHPRSIWLGNLMSHGISLSDDGNRAFLTDPSPGGGGNMVILDTSEIQARVPQPRAREISRLTWDSVSIPQNTVPFTSRGRPYVLEFDEYDEGTLSPSGDPHKVGAARIIDISDEGAPRIVSHLRLQVNQPDGQRVATDDPGAERAGQGYAAHYCNIPTRLDPEIVACSFIASGLRVFDISDVTAPREIAYFVAPSQPQAENGYSDSNYAMSQPAFVPERREIWYTDAASGLYVIRVDERVWPGLDLRLSRRCTAGGGLRMALVGRDTDRVRDVNFKFGTRLVARDTEPGFVRVAPRRTLRRARARELRAVVYLRDRPPSERVVLSRSLPRRCGR